MIYYIIFDPWAENVQESSLRKLAVVLGPYNLSKKSYGDYSPGGGTKVMLAPGLYAFISSYVNVLVVCMRQFAIYG